MSSRPFRRRWPRVDILVRGDSHYARPEAMTWLERNRVGYIFGLAGNPVLAAAVADLVEDAAVARAPGRGGQGVHFKGARGGPSLDG
jgi:hypothetical protein